MVERSPESSEMRTPAILSVMFHVLVLAAAVLNLDFFNRPPLMDPEPVMVEFEAIDKKAAAPTVGNPQFALVTVNCAWSLTPGKIVVKTFGSKPVVSSK